MAYLSSSWKWLALVLFCVQLLTLAAAANSKSSSSSSTPKVTFVDFPHRRIFAKYLEDGDWVAGDMAVFKKRLDKVDFSNLDKIQKAALREGIFFPAEVDKFHLFSAAEAVQCLRGRKVVFSGDSYMAQMFIGLVEILTNDPDPEEIANGTVRKVLLEKDLALVQDTFGRSFNLTFMYNECKKQYMNCYIDSIAHDAAKLEADSFVMNAMIHQLTLTHNEEKAARLAHYRYDLARLFNIPVNMTWATAPSYDIDMVPDLYKEHTKAMATEAANYDGMTLAHDFNLPYLDMFTITRRCRWSNCSVDGGHRTKFVNRMKAQMLLNNYCEVTI